MGDLLGFAGRHVIASIIGALGVIFYALGIAEQAEAIATRYKPWQWQSLGAVLFVVFVVMVLASYDKEVRARPEAATPTAVSSAPAQAAPNPNASESQSKVQDSSILPESVSNAYVALFSENATKLQKRRFLKPYEGKYLRLNLPVVFMENQNGGVWVQFSAGPSAHDSIFASFPPEWEDHLLQVKTGDRLHFQAQVVETRGGDFSLQNAAPI